MAEIAGLQLTKAAGVCSSPSHTSACDRRHLPRLLQVVQIAKDVAEGLAYMHPTLLHRDLK